MVQRLRNELERVVRERDRLVQLVRSRYDLVPQVTIHNNPAADITAQSSPVCRPSSVGMGQNMQQSKLGGSMDSSAFERGIPDDRAVRTGSLGSCPTQPRTNNWKPGHESGDECSSNVYDLPEPDWVSLSLSGYNEKIPQLGSNSSDLNQIKPNKTQQSTSSSTGLFPPGARGRGPAMASLNFLCETTTDLETESALTTPLSSQALITLLHNLAQRVPYPRLAEAMHCAELTWECVLATLARYRSDCVVLQANLAEAKSHADRIQCQLNQIDANWTATMRAAWMADTSLEIMDCLNQLYATELAILLYRQTKKSFLAAQTFSTLSSSTSSSSVPCRGKPAQNRYTTRPTGNGLVACGRPVQSSNPASVTPSSPQHPYAIYAVPGYAGSESESQAVPTTNVPSQFNLSLRTLRSIRYQAELSAQALLERYEQMDINTQDRFYPTVSSTSAGVGGCVNGNGGVVSASLTRGLTRAQNPAPVSPGLLSIHSPLGPPVPSTQSLTGSSLYANSWYVSLGRNGRSNGPGLVPEQTSLGSGLGSGYLIHQNKLPNYNLPLVRGSTKSVPQSHPVVSNGVIGSGGAVGNGVVSGGGGWQTPDSGAGSSSTHEVTQPVMFHTVFPSGLIDLNTYETVLDLMPSVPLYFRPGRVEDNAHSFCDSDSDTSESSDGDSRAPLHSTIPVTAAAQGHMGPSSTCGLIRSGHATTMTTAATTNNVASVITNPSTQSNLIPIQTGWSRADERKLRIWLYQLVHSRRILRSTIVENLPNLIEDDGLSDGHQSVTKGSFQVSSLIILTILAYFIPLLLLSIS
ncbi:hypothetical protein FGIG_07626 [Fasciola gigantica]|uniref:Uncharacterized protein n=1 Tax=Fasciola gigantica TaxID=46835 RepID=A0A504YL13_FASGI|nr:hypothetical protein FGIG_07626 [Fasciola gigantica]